MGRDVLCLHLKYVISAPRRARLRFRVPLRGSVRLRPIYRKCSNAGLDKSATEQSTQYRLYSTVNYSHARDEKGDTQDYKCEFYV